MIFALLIAVHPKLDAAERLYDDYQYAPAAKAFLAVLADPSFVDGPSRQRARLLLAFSYVWLGREGDASRELGHLFTENVDFPIDRADHHPSLLHVYDRERSRYLAPLARSSPSIIKPRLQASLGDRQPWLRAIPGGVGHFANRDPVTGGAFLGAELTLIAANITAAVLWYRLQTSDGEFIAGSRPVPLQIVMDATAIGAICLAVVEIVDAFVWSPGRASARTTGDTK